MIKHYVRYYYPGSFFAENSSEEIESRELFPGRFPKDCFAFQFFDMEAVKGSYDKWLYGEPYNHSGMYFNADRIYTTEEIEKEFPDKRILADNVRSSGNAVKTRVGNWQLFNPKEDHIL